MTEPQPEAVADEHPKPPDLRRSMLAMATSAAALWGGLWFAVGGTIGTLFAVGTLALVVPLVVLGVLVAVHIVISVTATGRRHFGGAVVVTLGAATLVGVMLSFTGGIPILWVVPPGLDVAYPIAAIAGALTFGLFLGPRPLRIVGTAAGVALLAAIVALPVSVQLEVQAEQAARDAEAVRVAERQRLLDFENFITDGLHPMVVDIPGAEVTRFDLVWSARSFVVTADGGVVEIAIFHWNQSNDPLTRCTFIGPPNQVHESADSLGDFADWCIVTGEDATLVDGTGISRIDDDRLVTVHTVELGDDINASGGSRPGTAEEVRAVFDALRPMTEAELRAEFSPAE